ncbi:MAG TPA: hypothetical protein VFU64_07285 [Gaiellaceae bacterium]|nr:hypothetical protein [Gaiellaceae bacterium]
MRLGQLVRVAGTLGLILLALSVVAGFAAASRSPVVVTKTGWGEEKTGPDASLYSFGAKVVNRSKRDAIGVTVTVRTWRPGGVQDDEDFQIVAIPAGKSFVVADEHGNLGKARLTRVTAKVHVRSLRPHDKTDRLPGVSRIRLDRHNNAVSAVITNRYLFPFDLQKASAYAVLYNSAGRIIGGGTAFSLWLGRGPKSLQPGRHTQVAIDVSGKMSQVARVEVSATP